jgi:hypothetical protein
MKRAVALASSLALSAAFVYIEYAWINSTTRAVTVEVDPAEARISAVPGQEKVVVEHHVRNRGRSDLELGELGVLLPL